jgi:predicted ATPase
MSRFVVISGCSGGGKSTLLAELARRGHAVIEEPGRRIVQSELESGGSALPWIDPQEFARRAMALACADQISATGKNGWVFFDRGIIDAAAALQHLTGAPVLAPFVRSHRYHRRAFLAPPWPEIYAVDNERRHDLESARAEYSRLLEAYPAAGYDLITLPLTTISARADFILAMLPQPPQ